MDQYPLRRISLNQIPEPQARLFDPEVDAVAAKAIEAVRLSGESALRMWAEKLGEIAEGDTILYSRGDLEAAYQAIPAAEQSLLQRVQGRVAAFAEAQRQALGDVDIAVPGGRAGHRFIPVARAGCYVPGGRYPLPSSAIMTVTPAKVAGVREVVCAGPKPQTITLAAAFAAGADYFLACGGAHAIAALAFGVVSPRCDVIVGPGGRYVASAKRQLFGSVGTEAPAGPSELLVIADDSADAEIAAADLLAQAEHDPSSVPMLACHSEAFAAAVETALARQLAALPDENRNTALQSLKNGWAFVSPRMEELCKAAETCAPEHLELMVAQADAYAQRIQSAGAVFIGNNSAEVFGDYGAGPNHTLPTGGAARFAGGLSVLNFLKARTWLALSEAEPLIADTAQLAKLERLEAHAQAALKRASQESRGV